MARKPQHSTADDKLQTVLNRLPHEPVRCIDVETSGLDWRKCHIVGYVATFSPNPADSYYIPFRHAGTGNVGGHVGPRDKYGWDGKLAPGEKELVKLLDLPYLPQSDQPVMNFGHNFGGFDLKFMWKTGYTFRPRHEDTQINAPLIDEWAGRFSLNACAQRHGVADKKVEIIRNHIRSRFPEATDKDYMGHYWRLDGDDPIAVEYAEGDGTTTWQLRDKQMIEIDAQDLRQVWDVESRLIPVLARMTTRGIKIDEERLHQVIEDTGKAVARLMDGFPSGFNARSPGDVQAWMEQHGATDWPLTPKMCKPSFPESWLETHPAGEQIVKVRKYENLLNSFMIPMRDTHLHNGRVHADFNQLRGDEYGTISGRLSSSNPNLQQVPKHNYEMGKLARSYFVPDQGKIWGATDYSQIEPRLLAMYSRCKALIDGYNSDPPIDAHTSASMLANPQWGFMSEGERKAYRDNIGKRVNQTVITGGGKGVLVSKYKVPVDQVDRVWNDYFRAMPEIRTFQNRASHLFKMRGYVLSPLKRRSRINDRDKAYVAVSRILQMGNADVLKIKMVEVDEYLASIGQPIDMLSNCHDAVDFQFDEAQRPVYDKCREIMADFGPNSAMPLDIPIVLDAGEGLNWAEATWGPEK